MHIPSFIEKKRDGGELGTEEIAEFIRGYTSGEVPDYQAAAWAMAVYFKGMTAAETGALTQAMMHSGTVLRHPAGSPPKVDKHSTGGIGDKVSLILAPLLACDDLWVPMISGRGLGITGGTLDKLESIPAFRVGLSEEETAAQLARIGVAMIGQTANLCPADKKLYALRDVTATVPSIPLIVASIMSKKLAESLDRLVLDVKFGSGAFMQNRADAETLAAALCATGRECGVQTEAILTPMSEPLGHTAGNALEVWESVETLQGRGPADLVKLTLDLAERVANVPRAQLAQWLDDGTAWRKWVELVEAQGGRAGDTEHILEIHAAPILHTVPAPHAGRLTRMDAGLFGRACIALGGGRSKASDAIDFAVGLSGIAKVGTNVSLGGPLLTIHARDEATLAQALTFVNQATEIAELNPP
ncbi:MAG: thymidine phosphorylase [Chthoniobacteraceae bacterium]